MAQALALNGQAIATLAVLVAVIVLLAATSAAADLVLMAALAVLVITGILTPAAALAGFSNTGVITVATLYVVAAGLRDTGAVQWIARALLGHPGSVRMAQFRMLIPTSVLSALTNNTTVVAMFIPAIQEWARRLKIPPSKFLLPLSYAAILGGTCTLIGTSTNLVVDGLLRSQLGLHLGIFDMAWVGIPVLIVGGLYLILFADRLLPDRGGISEDLAQVREYGVEVEVQADGPLSGKSVAEAGLRNLSSGYLAEVERMGRLVTSVGPDWVLEGGDRLYFIGAPECASEIRRIQGLQPASGSLHKLNLANHQRCLVEVVIGPEFPALGQTIRESRFRTLFNAVILSVSREGRRIPGKLGDIRFAVGDTLLLEAGQQFVEHYRFRRDFLLVSMINDSTPPDFHRAPRAMAILLAMVIASATGLLDVMQAAFVAAGLMIATGCITTTRARRSVDWSVLVAIAASFALGRAMTETGAAQFIAHYLTGGMEAPWLGLLVIYLLTAVFTAVITNNAAAVLMFPVALALARQMGVSFMPFAVAIMFAASASFVTPLGYQTNLMVFGPGRYRFSDYFRIGLPLSLVVALVAVLLIPLIWSF